VRQHNFFPFDVRADQVLFLGTISNHTHGINIFNATLRHTIWPHPRVALYLCFHSCRRHDRYLLDYEEVAFVAKEGRWDCRLVNTKAIGRR
jgi:hypothetical protein